jgi:glutamyl/glutaminyl-tRNA synthetase
MLNFKSVNLSNDSLMNNQPHFAKTRLAPTPSGYLHLGNVLSFVLTARLAKKSSAKILLRIDDLDRERANKLYIQDIFDTLNFLEIPWDEGPRNLQEYEDEWSQVHRMAWYQDVLQRLKDANLVFACNCSRAQIRAINADDTYPGTCRHKNIPLDAENVSWRLKTDGNRTLSIKAIFGEIIETRLPETTRDFVVRKKDGSPAYQLASVVDDLHFGIDLIVRGQDLWPSTLAQHYLAKCLGASAFGDIAFHHHPLLLADGGNKLSKSAGDTSVQYLRGQGKKPGDIFTLIAGMLGVNEQIGDWQELASVIS